MSQHPTQDRGSRGLSKFAWDLIAEQMLLAQLIGSVERVASGRPVARVCRHCGEFAAEHRLQSASCE